jgi:hypothetical protein
LNALLLRPRFVTGLYHAGEPTYNAIFSFSYVISAYNLIPGRPTQTNQIGSPACGGLVLAYDAFNDMGEEADAVYPGSPGGYVSFRGGATWYKAFMAVSSPVSAATIAVHVRVRSGWSSADFIIYVLPATASPQFSVLLLTGTSSSIFCKVFTSSASHSVFVTTPTLNEWHTYACTYDTTSDILAAYMDGSIVGMISATGTSSSTTSLSGSNAQVSIAPDLASHMDLKAAYSFASKKTASEIAELHSLMILDGTPRAFPS